MRRGHWVKPLGLPLAHCRHGSLQGVEPASGLLSRLCVTEDEKLGQPFLLDPQLDRKIMVPFHIAKHLRGGPVHTTFDHVTPLPSSFCSCDNNTGIGRGWGSSSGWSQNIKGFLGPATQGLVHKQIGNEGYTAHPTSFPDITDKPSCSS